MGSYMASLVLTNSSQLTSDSQHLGWGLTSVYFNAVLDNTRASDFERLVKEDQINQWLLDDSDEDLNISHDENDSDDSDIEQQANSEHDSDSEVSGDDIGQDQTKSSGLHYVGRDNVTLWNASSSSQQAPETKKYKLSQIGGEHGAHPRPTVLRDEARPTEG
uniref:Uncharacterized protein n=1 Tax=Timema shepardi TaxID=629360 RepID=A0A7R9AU06_TIMSH|nr:unnamed protein product [Timema shepardi]